jgi:hypothetical protein
MNFRRLTTAMLALSALVFGIAVLAGQGKAQAGSQLTYVCSAADRQFIDMVSQNMTQLGYWSDALVHNDAEPDVVAKQAKAEAAQVHATRPIDRTLAATRELLGSMFLEYSKAVAVTATGRDAKSHMDAAWRLAHASHDLLAGAKVGLAGQGCDVTPLLDT